MYQVSCRYNIIDSLLSLLIKCQTTFDMGAKTTWPEAVTGSEVWLMTLLISQYLNVILLIPYSY